VSSHQPLVVEQRAKRAARRAQVPEVATPQQPWVWFRDARCARSSTTGVLAIRRELTATTGGRAASSDETRCRKVRRLRNHRGYVVSRRSLTLAPQPPGELAVRRELTVTTGGRAASEASGQTRPGAGRCMPQQPRHASGPGGAGVVGGQVLRSGRGDSRGTGVTVYWWLVGAVQT